jgi:hypothetical protein
VVVVAAAAGLSSRGRWLHECRQTGDGNDDGDDGRTTSTQPKGGAAARLRSLRAWHRRPNCVRVWVCLGLVLACRQQLFYCSATGFNPRLDPYTGFLYGFALSATGFNSRGWVAFCLLHWAPLRLCPATRFNSHLGLRAFHFCTSRSCCLFLCLALFFFFARPPDSIPGWTRNLLRAWACHVACLGLMLTC